MAAPQRVLVVDDEQYYRDTIRDAVGLEGIACEVAASPAELLKAIEDPRIACVVLDVKLTPDPVGLIEALLEQRAALRVIALATQSDQDLVLAALHGGACDYLAKPIHDEELCLAVHRALRAYAIESRFAALSEQLWRLAEHGEPTAPGDREALAEPDEALLRALADRVAAPAPAPASAPRRAEDGARRARRSSCARRRGDDARDRAGGYSRPRCARSHARRGARGLALSDRQRDRPPRVPGAVRGSEVDRAGLAAGAG